MIKIIISNLKSSYCVTHQGDPIILGRNPAARDLPTHAIKDDYCSANQLWVEELPGARLRLENLSKRIVVEFKDAGVLEPGSAGEYPLPLRMLAGRTVIEIEWESPGDSPSALDRSDT